MFTGSVCGQVRDWFRDNAKLFDGRIVKSGCCGNFTVETVLSQYSKPEKLVSSDISLYTSAAGAYYTDSSVGNILIADDFRWIEPYCKDVLGLTASIVVMLNASQYAGCKTAYHKRIFEAYKEDFGKCWEKACEKLKKRKEMLKVNEYQAKDVAVFVEECTENDVFLSFMPTYAGGYERLYKFIDYVFLWKDRPSYEMMTLDGKNALLGKIAGRMDYVHIDDVRHDELNPVAAIEGGHGRPVYIHTNMIGAKTDVYSRDKTKRRKPNIPLLAVNQELSERPVLSLVKLASEEFAWVRDQFLKKSIIPAEPSWKFGVCLDRILVGLIVFSRGKDGQSYYMTCDLALPSARYNRLSKLVITVANSKEMLRVLRQQTGQFWDTFSTTAFTDKPVSMKYRGILDLLGRNTKEGKLNYGGNYKFTFTEAVEKWLQAEKISLKQK